LLFPNRERIAIKELRTAVNSGIAECTASKDWKRFATKRETRICNSSARQEQNNGIDVDDGEGEEDKEEVETERDTEEAATEAEAADEEAETDDAETEEDADETADKDTGLKKSEARVLCAITMFERVANTEMDRSVERNDGDIGDDDEDADNEDDNDDVEDDENGEREEGRENDDKLKGNEDAVVCCCLSTETRTREGVSN